MIVLSSCPQLTFTVSIIRSIEPVLDYLCLYPYGHSASSLHGFEFVKAFRAVFRFHRLQFNSCVAKY